jgi:hypothetical protein
MISIKLGLNLTLKYLLINFAISNISLKSYIELKVYREILDT